MPRPLNSTDTGLTVDNLLRLLVEFGYPVWIYDAQIIREQIVKLSQSDMVRFAQRACSSIHILHLMCKQGVKVDSVSLGETERMLATGSAPGKDEIVSTADMIDKAAFTRMHELSVPVNTGSADMLEQLSQVSSGHCIQLRVNPGFGHGHSQKTDTGGENSKYGIWCSDPPTAPGVTQHYRLRLVGTHMHIGSGMDYAHLEQMCGAMMYQVAESGQDLETISAGGGLSIPYHEDEETIDTDHYFGLWNVVHEQTAKHLGHPIALEIELGRSLAAEAGMLAAQVCNVKEMGSHHLVLIDAGFNDLVRPAIYGSYHHISALSGDGRSLEHTPQWKTVVTGPLCESDDVLTQQEGRNVEIRLLLAVMPDDYLVLHGTGMYSASMSSNYNSRLLLPEVLSDNGVTRLIRRCQVIDELLALELT